mgnify:CR=1 FL=1
MAERLLHTPVFDVHGFQAQTPGGERTYYRLQAPDWVNIAPITEDGRIVLIRQHRWGIDEETLEIPGGMVDPGEEPVDAAVRELREETGYGGGQVRSLGWIHPNPAIQDNRCWLFVMENARRIGETDLDEGEAIETQVVSREELSRLVRDGTLSHALAVVTLQRLLARWPDVS